MLKFTATTVSTDNPSMLVKNLKTGTVGNQTHPKDFDESDYVEITKADYELQQRAAAIRDVYVREVNRRMAERYTSQEESAITRKALALLLNPQALSEDSTDEDKSDRILAEFNEYNNYAESVKMDVALHAEEIYEAEQ